MSTVAKARRAAAWTPLRRITDLLPQVIPGRHHNLDSSLMALMLIREVSA